MICVKSILWSKRWVVPSSSFFPELITTQLRDFHMVSPQVVLLVSKLDKHFVKSKTSIAFTFIIIIINCNEMNVHMSSF